MSGKDRDVKKLKYRLKIAVERVFSVAAKTQSTQEVHINQIFGSGHYRVHLR
jgi:hypothetical protein